MMNFLPIFQQQRLRDNRKKVAGYFQLRTIVFK